MATFNLHTFANSPVRGTKLSKKADGIVLMGALVKKGTAAGDVAEASANTSIIMGVAVYDEARAFTNDADQYEDNDPLAVETIVPGMVLNLLNSGTASIAEGVRVEAAADGKITAGTTNPVGVTNEVIAGSSRGAVIMQFI